VLYTVKNELIHQDLGDGPGIVLGAHAFRSSVRVHQLHLSDG